MSGAPLSSPPLFWLGPVPLSGQVLSTWAIIAVLFVLCRWMRPRLQLAPGRLQALLEWLVEDAVPDPADAAGRPGTVPATDRHAVRVHPVRQPVVAGPGNEAPTAHIETDAALAGIVFVSVIVFGIRSRGLRGYLKPSPAPAG